MKRFEGPSGSFSTDAFFRALSNYAETPCQFRWQFSTIQLHFSVKPLQTLMNCSNTLYRIARVESKVEIDLFTLTLESSVVKVL